MDRPGWLPRIDLTPRTRRRVAAMTVLGTLACIAAAFAVDSYSPVTNTWRWGSDPINNLLIPVLVAPPFFYFMLNKLRELAEAHHELMVISSTDALTSLYNRRAFTALVEASLARHEASAQSAAQPAGGMLVVDVDHFKAVNDRYGHDQGDEALKLVAAALRRAVSADGIVGRIGGEEFCVFLPFESLQGTEEAAERIRLSVRAAAFMPEGRNHTLSVSVGGAVTRGAPSFGALYRAADQQLFMAKRGGRNRVEIEGRAGGSPGMARQIMH